MLQFYLFRVWGHSKSTFAQDSRFLTLSHPLFDFVRFQKLLPSPPLPQGTFILARTHPLPLSFCTCEI